MITFKELTLQNFWSFGNKPTTVNLDRKETILIVGNNQDKGDSGNESRNGAGKSSLFLGVIWCLFGEGTEKVSQDGFINFVNKKKCEVSLTFEMSGDTYQIIRGRKPNKLQLFINNVDQSRDSVANTQKYIEELIGMNFDIFTHTELLYVHDKPFMAMKDAEQRNFMEDFLSLETLTRRANTLKSLEKDNKADIRVEEERLQRAKEQNEWVTNQINTLQEKSKEWTEQQETKIKRIQEEMDAISTRLEEHEDRDREILKEYDEKKQEYSKLNEKIKRERENERYYNDLLQKFNSFIEQLDRVPSEVSIREQFEKRKQKLDDQIEAFPVIDYEKAIAVADELEKIAQNHESLGTKKEDYEKELTRISTRTEEVEREIEQVGAGVCPRCEQEWHSDDASKEIERLTEELKRYNDEYHSISQKIEEVAAEMDTLVSEYQEKEEDPNLIDDWPLDSNHYQKEYNNLKSIKEKISMIDDQMEEKIQEHNNQENDILEQIESLLQTMDRDADDIEVVIEELSSSVESCKKKEGEIDKELSEIQAYVESIGEDIRNGNVLTEEKISALKDDIHHKDQQVIDLKNEVNPYDSQIKDGSWAVYHDDSEDHYYQLKKYEEHYKILIKLLTDNKSFIRKNIINQYVPYINKKINEYLAQLDSQHIVEINSDLSVNLFYMDHSVGYGNLSRGEKLRLNLGTSLAFRDLNGLLGKSSNLLMVDEYLDAAVDPAGFKQVFNLLKQFSLHTMIISHRDDLMPMVDRIMTVTKKNAFTTISYGDSNV